MNKSQFDRESNFAELLDESFSNKEVIEGQVVVGTIVNIKDDKAIIDVGLKSEGKLFLNDIKILKGKDNISIGDTLDVYIEKFEDKNGEPILSIEKARKDAIWKNMEAHLTSGEPIEGIITGRTKGGYTVDINGTTAFLPGSQVDLRPVKDINPYLNTKYQFRIIKMDRLRNNIVISRRLVLEVLRDEAKAEIISKLEEGMVIPGIVKNITDYGAFIDIGGIDGLLHVTDISWKRIANPNEVLKIGDNIQVQVIKFNKESGRISLGLKQLTKSPWEGITDKYIVGNKYKGKVVNIADYGVFVELEELIEGMIYITELSWTKKNIHPSKIVAVGDEVEVVVLDINLAKKKISLGYKQCQENPWQKFANEHPIGMKLQGVIKNITEFGIFVGVSETLDGMVHVSDLFWHSGDKNDKSKNFSIGQTVNVVVLDIKPDKERINLGIKQLEADPFEKAAACINKGDIVSATVKEILLSGIEVTLDNGLPGFIKKVDISADKFRQKLSTFSVGEKIKACVFSIDKTSHKVGLSIRALEIKHEKEALEKFGSTDSNANLGDILGEAMKSNSNSGAE
ncbi:MAG: 30S ribosomal protein S1 [Holosporales bacterium]|jgi:small subunit ribosomal protein S1|nr:30S ribosomal protein S1 [Holosporales bacterium]